MCKIWNIRNEKKIFGVKNGFLMKNIKTYSQPSFGNKFVVDELSWQLPPGGQLIQSHDILSLMLVVSCRYSSYRLQSRGTFHAGRSQADLFSFGILPLDASHGLHWVAPPVSAMRFDGQRKHHACPVVDWYLPTSQIKQYGWPCLSWKVPTAHWSHFVCCPCSCFQPAGQDSQRINVSEKYFPAKHGEQNEAPGCENCPEAHVMQSARESWSVGELVWSKAR